ncbi:MAG: hypothetical protein JNM25_14980, partial [Planctomycetes bacterium]|nr:hypothetical protein [Planctomycetota bacterium]
MAQLDPTKIHVASDAQPVWETQVSFQDTMAEQFRRAPWLMVSVGLHAVALLLLYVLLPAEERRQVAKKVEVAQQAVQPVETPRPIEPPTTTPEPVHEPTEVRETEVADTESSFDRAESDVPSTESSFTSDQWNTAVGLTGGAGGPSGGRRGSRSCRTTHKSFAESIDAGLRWLKNHQDEDGKWDCDGFMKHDVEGEVCDGPGNAVHDVGV